MFETKLIDKDTALRNPKYAASSALFYKKDWLEAVSSGMGAVLEWMATYRNNEMISITPFLKLKKGPFVLAGSPLRGSLTPCLGPAWIAEAGEDDKVEALRSQQVFLKRSGASYIEWRFKEKDIADRAFAATGLKYKQQTTLIISIENDEDKMWKKMQSRARNMVRKAEKSGVTIRRLQGSEEEVEEYYDILRQTFQKHATVPPHPITSYKALVRNLTQTNNMLFLAAEHHGKIVAAGIFPHDNAEIRYLSGASTPEANPLAANNLIQWEVIKYAIKQGLRSYDLGGTGMASIDKFKISIGGETAYFHRYVWSSVPAKLAESLYLRLRKIGGLVKSALNR